MKAYMRFLSIIILCIGAVCFYLSYLQFQFPYDAKGIYVNEDGEILKRSAAIKTFIFGVLSIVFVLVWNMIYKRISAKKE